MSLVVAVTVPPHKEPGIILIGSPTEPVEEMTRLQGYHLDIDTFTPEIASKVEDIVLREGYVVTSGWEYLIEFCSADVKPLAVTNER